MTRGDIQTAANKKLDAIMKNKINLLEVLDRMIAIKEIDVFINGYSDGKIHEPDIRLELLALYKARDLFTKEKNK
jgi:hypothetical protein